VNIPGAKGKMSTRFSFLLIQLRSFCRTATTIQALINGMYKSFRTKLKLNISAADADGKARWLCQMGLQLGFENVESGIQGRTQAIGQSS